MAMLSEPSAGLNYHQNPSLTLLCKVAERSYRWCDAKNNASSEEVHEDKGYDDLVLEKLDWDFR